MNMRLKSGSYYLSLNIYFFFQLLFSKIEIIFKLRFMIFGFKKYVKNLNKNIYIYKKN